MTILSTTLIATDKPVRNQGFTSSSIYFYISFTRFYSDLRLLFEPTYTFAFGFNTTQNAMNNVNRPVFTLLACLLSYLSFGQDQAPYRHCSAAFLGSKMIVNKYSPTGKCTITATATGELTVNTVDLSINESKRVDRLSFRIAIRDKETKTLYTFSGQEYQKVDIQTVLARCRKGDMIVLLTTNDRYALPHNEILVQ